jgi:hypothetical protein
MSKSNCKNCGQLTDAGPVCTRCVDQLLDVLADVPEMVNELRVTLSRQTKMPAASGMTQARPGKLKPGVEAPIPGEAPVVFNERASDLSLEYARMILRWQARLADHLNPSSVPGQVRPPYRVSEPVRFMNPIAAASWMWTQIRERGIASWADAATMVRRLVDVDKQVEELIDRPVPVEYLGECELPNEDGQPCGGDVYAGPDDAYGECRRCKGLCDAQQQRLSLLTWLDERLMTAAEIARMTVWLGLRMDRDTVRKRINQWHSRGRVPCVPVCAPHVVDAATDDAVDETASPTFRFRDVRLLLEATEHGKATA